jgi:hypothetical protein
MKKVWRGTLQRGPGAEPLAFLGSSKRLASSSY